MREELYNAIKNRLEALCINSVGEYYERPDEADVDDELYSRAIQHIDLWNRNIEFIEQESAWARPAVFIEFLPIKWNAKVPGVEYRGEVQVNLHLVTDWDGGEGMAALRLTDAIHEVIAGMDGDDFKELDLVASMTNHDHEEIVENIETYACVGFRHFG